MSVIIMSMKSLLYSTNTNNKLRSSVQNVVLKNWSYYDSIEPRSLQSVFTHLQSHFIYIAPFSKARVSLSHL